MNDHSRLVVLHVEERKSHLELKKIVPFIKEITGFSVRIECFSCKGKSLRNYAKQFASCRLQEGLSRFVDKDIEYEIRYLKGIARGSFLYDGFRLSVLYGDLIRESKAIHIVATNRLIGTCDNLQKPHIRSIILSHPAIISFPGIVEGPAKPREFYALKHRFTSLGIWQQNQHLVKEKFRNRFIDHADMRLSEVLKGFVSQAIVYARTSEAFCSVKSCRLFNAHWQRELIYSQITSARFCRRHKRILTSIKDAH